jgi:hypothetical protein
MSIGRTLAVALVVVFCSVSVAMADYIEVRDLDASVTSVSFPTIPGNPESGEFRISLIPNFAPTPELLNAVSFNRDTRSGLMFWPVRVECSLFESQGIDFIDMVLVGTVFAEQSDDEGFLIAFDMGYIEHELLGQVVCSNNNKNVKVDLSKFYVLDDPVAGSFVDIDQEIYGRLEQAGMHQAISTAYAALRSAYPAAPVLDDLVLNTFEEMYGTDPGTEIILYFPDAPAGDRYRTAQLTGTDTLAVKQHTTRSTPSLTIIGVVIAAVAFAGTMLLVLRRRFAASRTTS